MYFQCIFSGQAGFAIFQAFRPFSIKKFPVPNFWNILWGHFGVILSQGGQ